MTMITPSYLGETIEYSSLHACRSTLEDPTYGAQTHATVGDTAGMLTAAKNDYSLDPTRLTLPTATTACNCSDTGASVSCNSSTACNGAHIEINLTVQTQATFDPGFYEPFLPDTFTVTGTAVQKVLQ